MSNQKKILDISGLKSQFGKRIVHPDISLQVMEGEVLGILGGSGSGKSVLLRSLIGLEVPTAGTCHFNGIDLFGLRESEWSKIRTQIAYAFQAGALFDSLTVAENLAYPLRAHTNWTEPQVATKIMDLLKLVGLPQTKNMLPAELSGGMQKRIGLARAIALDPAIILYDEPTAGLDPSNSQKISDLILHLNSLGKTAIVVTHDTQCVRRVAHRIAFIFEGKIAALQSMDQVMNSPHPLIDSYLKGTNAQ